MSSRRTKKKKGDGGARTPFQILSSFSMAKVKLADGQENYQIYFQPNEKSHYALKKYLFQPEIFAQAWKKFEWEGRKPELRAARRMISFSTSLAIVSGRYYFMNPETQGVECFQMSRSRLENSIKKTRMITNDQVVLKKLPKRTSRSTVHVFSCDTLDMVEYLHEQPDINGKIGVLNFASASNPGGGWEKGSAAQEESLCRRTTLICTLSDPWRFGEKECQYPIPEYGCVYSPDVCIFRKSFRQGYAFLPQPIYADFISSATYRHPPLKDTNAGLRINNSNIVNWTLRKMRRIFEVAISNGIQHLVLGAWGCGVYANPPEHIAQLFQQVLGEYQGLIKSVYFAIPGDLDNFRTHHNPNGNLQPFADRFKVDIQHLPGYFEEEEEEEEIFEEEISSIKAEATEVIETNESHDVGLDEAQKKSKAKKKKKKKKKKKAEATEVNGTESEEAAKKEKKKKKKTKKKKEAQMESDSEESSDGTKRKRKKNKKKKKKSEMKEENVSESEKIQKVKKKKKKESPMESESEDFSEGTKRKLKAKKKKSKKEIEMAETNKSVESEELPMQREQMAKKEKIKKKKKKKETPIESESEGRKPKAKKRKKKNEIAEANESFKSKELSTEGEEIQNAKKEKKKKKKKKKEAQMESESEESFDGTSRKSKAQKKKKKKKKKETQTESESEEFSERTKRKLKKKKSKKDTHQMIKPESEAQSEVGRIAEEEEMRSKPKVKVKIKSDFDTKI